MAQARDASNYDLSTDQGVTAARESMTGKKLVPGDESCIRRPQELPIIVVGTRSLRFGCVFDGVFVKSHYLGPDLPGPNREVWRKHVGSYVGTSYGREVKTDVLLKNGYLYVSRGGGLRLHEYKPDLFFTAEGEAVIFREGVMRLGNRPYRKKVTPG